MTGVKSIHTHPSESEDLWRRFRFGRNAKRNLNRRLLVGVFGGVGAGVIGPAMVGRANRPRRSFKVACDENTVADGEGEQVDGDMDDFGVTLRGVDDVEHVAVVVASPSNGRRLRSRRRRRGRYGHEPAGEAHSFSCFHSGIGEVSETRKFWAVLAVTST